MRMYQPAVILLFIVSLLISCSSAGEQTESENPSLTSGQPPAATGTKTPAAPQVEYGRLSEAQMQSSNGDWMQTRDGKVYARLRVKYASEADVSFELFKGNEGKATLQGKLKADPTGIFIFEECGIQFVFDTKHYAVGGNFSGCQGVEFDFSGDYLRK